MNLKKFLLSLITPQPKFGESKSRLQLKDVKRGQRVWVEWERIKGSIGWLKCLNNDPETKRILLEAEWNNYKENGIAKFEKVIFNYSDDELKNFHLLNSYTVEPKNDEEENNYDISALQKSLNEALDKEEYELADKLQRKINKLLKK